MHRTQLYLDDDLWNTLKARAHEDGTTISELARAAMRDRYMNQFEERRAAMLAIVGLWKDRTDLPDTETYIRALRDDSARVARLGIE